MTSQLHHTLGKVSVRGTPAWHMPLEGQRVPPVWSQLSQQAWLTEIQDYAQHSVVLMLLGNKVGTPACPLHPGSAGG